MNATAVMEGAAALVCRNGCNIPAAGGRRRCVAGIVAPGGKSRCAGAGGGRSRYTVRQEPQR